MRSAHRRIRLGIAAVVVVFAALALAWRYTPLSQYATPERVTAAARYAASKPWTPLALVVAYPVSAVVMFPRPLITLFAVVAFGPVAGFALAMCGVLVSSLSAYGAGRRLPAKAVDRLTPSRLRDLRDVIRERGLASALAVSIVPVAPFAVVGVAMGAMRVKLRHYVAGVLIGHLPGTLTTAILGHQLKRALADRAAVSPALIGGAILFLIVTTLVVRRWFERESRAIAARRQ
jgi:uncharacterized membrane protein YdjX (TVP38/TMEM64 family)